MQLIKQHICLLFVVINYTSTASVSYTLSQGRFGDQVMAYAKAAWIAYKYKIPLQYTPFEGSSLLKLDQKHTHICPEINLKSKVIIDDKTIIKPHSKNLYIANLSTHFEEITSINSLFDLTYHHPDFKSKLQKALSPHQTVKPYSIPFDPTAITVALHVRKGSGMDKSLHSKQYYDYKEQINIPITLFDTKNESTRWMLSADERYPHKFPPDQYYIESLKALSTLLKDQTLHVYFFTDAKNRDTLITNYQKQLQGYPIIFVPFSESYKKNARYIDDYWNISRCDCLIRSDSNFSRAAQLLGNHSIIIYPNKCIWHGKTLMIESINITIHHPNRNKREQIVYFPISEPSSLPILSNSFKNNA